MMMMSFLVHHLDIFIIQEDHQGHSADEIEFTAMVDDEKAKRNEDNIGSAVTATTATAVNETETDERKLRFFIPSPQTDIIPHAQNHSNRKQTLSTHRTFLL